MDELPSYNGMNCVSDVDYSLSENRKADMLHISEVVNSLNSLMEAIYALEHHIQ